MTQQDDLEPLVECALRQLHRAPPEVRAAFKELEGVWRRSLVPKQMTFLPVTPPAPPVCSTCNDTHLMGEEQVVCCTKCPTPCTLCRAGATGAYCEYTPCLCACHIKHPAPPVDPLASVRAAIEERRARIREEKAILREEGRSLFNDDRAPTCAVVRVNGKLGVVGEYQHPFRDGTWIRYLNDPADISRKLQWHPDQGRWGEKTGNTLEILEIPPAGWSDV